MSDPLNIRSYTLKATYFLTELLQQIFYSGSDEITEVYWVYIRHIIMPPELKHKTREQELRKITKSCKKIYGL